MTAFDNTTPVLVLGVSKNPTLAIARSLGRLGVTVIAVGTESRAPACVSRYFSRRLEWGLNHQPEVDSVAFLKHAARRLGKRPLLLATNDDGVAFMARHADVLAADFIFPRQPAELTRALLNKRDLYRLAESLGIPTPLSAFPAQESDVREFLSCCRFPVLIKGIDGSKLERHCGRKHVIVHAPADLLQCYRDLENPAEPNLMLQEFIPGKDDDSWLFNGYFDEQSHCRMAATGRKLRQAPIHTGAASFGCCTWNQTIADYTLSLMQTVGYAGILDVDYRFDARDGRYKLLDVNPRVGSTFRLFVTKEGLDVVQVCYRHLTGQPVPPSVPIEDRRWLVEDTDLLAACSYWREGSLRWRDWRTSLKGIDEWGWFAQDDRRPFWMAAQALAVLLCQGAGRRVISSLRRVDRRPPRKAT